MARVGSNRPVLAGDMDVHGTRGITVMGWLAGAMRIIDNKRAATENRRRSEDYLRQLEIERLQREARIAEDGK